MNVQKTNNCTQPKFMARLSATNSVMKLTKQEVVAGRFNAYKNALEKLDSVHKSDVLDIIAPADCEGYIVVNINNGNSEITNCSSNLTDAINEIARPTSEIHKKIFDCNGSNEVNEIRKEFYT